MENKTHFLAIDLGATSGRTILGTLDGGALTIEELTRFPNVMVEMNGHFYWNMHHFYTEIIAALKQVATRDIPLASIGVDTWGVDVAFFGKDGELLGQPYAYRDPYTVDAPGHFFREMDSEQLYGLTGIQIMNFNTIFQLHTLWRNDSSIQRAATRILFMPDAISYLLTGKMVVEYTIASTSQLLDPVKRQFNDDLLKLVGLSPLHFPPIVMPGEQVGVLTPTVQRLSGLGPVPVVAVAGHDTASAVVALPATSKRVAYLSSGTWSLMGIETPHPVLTAESYRLNFTNEGGADGQIRLLKNICGMWLLERCREEWGDGQEYAHAALIDAALSVPPFRSLINPDATRFANPSSMLGAICSYCEETGQPVPHTPGEMTRCIFESLALRYKQVFEMLCTFAEEPLETLHIIGGGSKNNLLNAFTANALGVTVVAGPSEATAIGNIMLQARAIGLVPDLTVARALIRDSVEIAYFYPVEQERWADAYNVFLSHYRE